MKIFVLFFLLTTLSLGNDLITFLNSYIDEEITMSDGELLLLETVAEEKPYLSRLSREEVDLFFWLDYQQKKWILENKPVTFLQLIESGIVSLEKIQLMQHFTREGQPRRIPLVRPKQIDLTSKSFFEHPQVPNDDYQGLNLYQSFSLSLEFKNSQGYLSFEKDPYERSFFDYVNYNYHKSVGNHSKFFLGNMLIKWGQGLLIQQGFTFSSLIDNPLMIYQGSNKISPDYSFSENMGIQGIGWSYQINPHFTMHNVLVYTLYDTNLDEEGKATTIDESGYHRTESEKQNRNQLTEKLVASYLNYTWSSFSIGSGFYYSDYDPEFTSELSERSLYNFQGSKNRVGAISMQYEFDSSLCFIETARSKSSASAIIAGILGKLPYSLRYSLSWRYYAAEFQNFHAGAYSYRNENQNEKGFTLALDNRLIRKLKFSFSLDHYQNIERTYHSPFPGKYYKIQLGAEFYSFKILANFKQSKLFDQSSMQEEVEKQQGLRLTWKIYKKRTNHFSLRIETKKYQLNQNSSDYGLLVGLMQSTSFRKVWDIKTNLLWFTVDDYDARIYHYSYQLPHSWSILAFYHQGIYINQVLSYEFKKVRFYFKSGLKIYNQEMTMSDGRKSNIFSKIGFYLHYYF